MFKRISLFLKETKTELLHKTTWPTKDVVLSSTVVVIVSIIIVSLCLFVVDVGVSRAVRWVVVQNAAFLSQYLNAYSFLAFIIGLIVFLYFYQKIKKRLG